MDIDKDELMASIKKELEPEITKISFDTWIAPLGIRSIEGNNIVFKGNGWGHGCGMEQWGAYAMAKEGKKAPAIVEHYYPNCHLVTLYE